MKGQAIAFCAGLALAWCATADAAPPDDYVWYNKAFNQPELQRSAPSDRAEVAIDDLRDRVTQLEGLIKALLPFFLPECSGEPPEKMPCIEKGLDEND